MQNSSLSPLVDGDHLVYGIGYAVKDDEPIDWALATVRKAVHNIWERFPEAKYHRIFIGGPTNFRDKVATMQVYKGNRDPSKKPRLYDEIRQYLVDYHGAEISDGIEAEDDVGILQYAAKDKSTVIVAVDKDLQCIPGYHYHPKKGTLTYVTLAQANENFWRQVIMGDQAVDNIRGLDGLGPVKAQKILNPCGRDWMKMHEAVLAAYRNQYGERAESAMDETAKLVWILRERGVTYDGSSIET